MAAMQWVDGNVRVSHPREPWGPRDEMVFVHCRITEVKGTDSIYGTDERARYEKQYSAAKTKFDVKSAFDIIDRCIDDQAIDRIVDVLTGDPILVFPLPPFDEEEEHPHKVRLTGDPINAIPFAYVEYLARVLGGTVNTSIAQIARIGTTDLTRWMRYLCQPSFEGTIDRKKPYILVDDVFSSGGTFAALRSYIVRNGGAVAGTTALANKSGVHEIFAIADQTLYVLRSSYGSELDPFWRETFGHDLRSLTEPEGQFLVLAAHNWAKARKPLLQCLRERINQAAAKGG
jgi:hypothetical protein